MTRFSFEFDRLRAAAGVEIAAAEIGVAILDAAEHLFGQLHVDAAPAVQPSMVLLSSPPDR